MSNWPGIEQQYAEQVYSVLYRDRDAYAEYAAEARGHTIRRLPQHPALHSLVQRMDAMTDVVTLAIQCLSEKTVDVQWEETDLARKDFIYRELLHNVRGYLDGEDSFRYCGLHAGADRHMRGAEAF